MNEPGLPPGSRPPDEDEVDDLLAKIDGVMGEDPSQPPRADQRPGGWLQWSVAGAIGCGLAAAVAVFFGWRPAPWLAALGVWQAAVLEGAMLGFTSGLAFSWWEFVQRGRINPLSCALLLAAMVWLYLSVGSYLLELALGSQDRLSVKERAGVSLQLAGVLLAALLGHLKARVLPLRPLLGLAGGVFVSSCLAQLVNEQVGGSLVGTTGLPYGFALPMAWTLAELFGRPALETGAD